MQYLFDDEASAYLDAYNNVPHVGPLPSARCPRRPRADGYSQHQHALPDDLVNQVRGGLCANAAEPLGVCFFLNSASEANELAIRLARTHTRQPTMIVLEAGLSGHTNAADRH